MIYIASPYTHPDPEVRKKRYLQVHHYTRTCMDMGEVVFSPIVYGHEFTGGNEAAISHHYWQRFNEHILINATQMRILKLKGWEESAGIKAELDFAQRNNIPVVARKLLVLGADE